MKSYQVKSRETDRNSAHQTDELAVIEEKPANGKGRRGKTTFSHETVPDFSVFQSKSCKLTINNPSASKLNYKNQLKQYTIFGYD